MKTPWHLWVVGILSLLWNSGGAFDYVMMKTSAEAYTSQLTADQLAYFDSFPFIVSVGWALGVWGAILGSVLLLLRSRFAAHAFALSLLGLAINTIWGFVISPTPVTAITGPGTMLFTLAIIVVAVLLYVYARAMTNRGVLR